MLLLFAILRDRVVEQQVVAMRIQWMFRATKIGGGERGTLSVLRLGDESLMVQFDANDKRLLLDDEDIVFTSADGSVVGLPSPYDPDCRDLGEACFMKKGSLTFGLRSRLPVTADCASTTVVSVKINTAVGSG